MTKVDREALKRALATSRSNPEYAVQIETILSAEPWDRVAGYAAYCCQIDNLGLQPWQDPPMYAELESGTRDGA
jgi:hypothetical protein